MCVDEIMKIFPALFARHSVALVHTGNLRVSTSVQNLAQTTSTDKVNEYKLTSGHLVTCTSWECILNHLETQQEPVCS